MIIAVGATAAACSQAEPGDDANPAVTTASTLPYTQTPEYIASNTQCPEGLTELGAVSLGSDTPADTVRLVPYLSLDSATVMVFDDPGAKAQELGSDQSGGGYVGDRSGRIWRFEPSVAGQTTSAGTADAESADTESSSGTALGGQAGGDFGFSIGAEPIADFSSNTAIEHDQGLVGMTLGPNGRLWTNRTDERGRSVVTVLTPSADRKTLQGDPADLLEVKQTNAQHNGGDLLFDDDGLLYVSFGDGGGSGDPHHHGQNLTTPLGALLRLDVDTNLSIDARDWQLVPAPGNPDLGPGSDPRIWVYGIRNPFRMSLDETTGALWVSDVGQQCMEEVTALNLDEGGANLGWNAYEGSRRFVGDELSNHRAPDFEYRHGLGLCSVIGGHVYRGSELEWLRGRYVFADLCGGDIYAAEVNPGTQPDEVWDLGVETPRPVGFAVDGAGEMYVIDIESGVWRLTGKSPTE